MLMSQLGTTRVLNKRISLISHIYILVIHYIFQIPLSGIYLERIGNHQRRRQATISHQHIVSLMCANRHVQMLHTDRLKATQWSNIAHAQGDQLLPAVRKFSRAKFRR